MTVMTDRADSVSHAYMTLELYQSNERELDRCLERRRIYASEFCRAVGNLPVPDELSPAVLSVVADGTDSEFRRDQRDRVTRYVFGGELVKKLDPKIVKTMLYNGYTFASAEAVIIEFSVCDHLIHLQVPLWHNASPNKDWTLSEFDLKFSATYMQSPSFWASLGDGSASYDPAEVCRAIRDYVTRGGGK